MKKCACGCSQEVNRESSNFLPGHASKLRAKKNTEQEEKTSQSQSDPAGAFLKHSTNSKPLIPHVNPADDNNKEQKRTKLYYILVVLFVFAGALQYFLLTWLKIHWIFLVVLWVINLIILAFLIWTVWRLRKKQEPVVFKTIEDFIEKVPKWAIDEKSPKSGLVGRILNTGKDFKQLVLVSENFEPKSVWVEWDGFLFRIGNRAYRPPRDVRGEVFFYHVDKKTPLIDSAEATQEDAEDSYHELAVWNQAFSVGHAAALNETQHQVKMILILVALVLIVEVGFAIYVKGQMDGINEKLAILQKSIEQHAAVG